MSHNPRTCTECCEELEPPYDPPRGICRRCWRDLQESKRADEEPYWKDSEKDGGRDGSA